MLRHILMAYPVIGEERILINNITRYKYKIMYSGFDDWRDFYNRKDFICGHLGRVYNFRYDYVSDNSCNKWNCAKCRRYKKWIYYLQVMEQVFKFGLFYHLVITFKGSNYRSRINWIDSYKFMSNSWSKLRYRIYRRYGKINFILNFRSQKSGYCHLHGLLSDVLDFDWLKESCEQVEMGWTRFKFNPSINDYINDFFKDNEWCIPIGRRHFSSSRSIKFNFQGDPFWDENNIYLPHGNTLDELEYRIFKKYRRVLPYEEYVKKFVMIK